MSLRPILAASLLLAASGNTLAQPAHCGGDGRCKVAVSVDAGKSCGNAANIKVSPDTVRMGRSPNRTIVWKLDTPGFQFCPASGDGIQFKGTTNDQFFGAAATDNDDGDDDGAGATKCRKHFRWKNKNEQQTFGRNYSYVVRFTGPSGQVCIKDPFVRNG